MGLPSPRPFELGRVLLGMGSLQRRRHEKAAARETLARAATHSGRRGRSCGRPVDAAEAARIGAVGRRMPISPTWKADREPRGRRTVEQGGRRRPRHQPEDGGVEPLEVYAKTGVSSRTELVIHVRGRGAARLRLTGPGSRHVSDHARCPDRLRGNPNDVRLFDRGSGSSFHPFEGVDRCEGGTDEVDGCGPWALAAAVMATAVPVAPADGGGWWCARLNEWDRNVVHRHAARASTRPSRPVPRDGGRCPRRSSSPDDGIRYLFELVVVGNALIACSTARTWTWRGSISRSCLLTPES